MFSKINTFNAYSLKKKKCKFSKRICRFRPHRTITSGRQVIVKCNPWLFRSKECIGFRLFSPTLIPFGLIPTTEAMQLHSRVARSAHVDRASGPSFVFDGLRIDSGTDAYHVSFPLIVRSDLMRVREYLI